MVVACFRGRKFYVFRTNLGVERFRCPGRFSVGVERFRCIEAWGKLTR